MKYLRKVAEGSDFGYPQNYNTIQQRQGGGENSIKIYDDGIRELEYTTTENNQEVKIFETRERDIGYLEIDGVVVSEIIPNGSNSEDVFYTFSTPGKHIVRLRFSSTGSVYYLFHQCSTLTKVPWNLFNRLTSSSVRINGVFSGCSGLIEVPGDIFRDIVLDYEGFSSVFYGCSELRYIPEYIFFNAINVGDATFTFEGCSKIKEIPKDLFRDCPNIDSFQDCFNGCTGLTEIPGELFKNKNKVYSFMNCFYGCTGLESVPEGLFDDCPNISQIDSCFRGCSNLKTIPRELFKNNTEVGIFNYCFSGCTSLESPVPIDSDGTPIYNRSGEGKEGYKVIHFSGGISCFYNCTRMQDYNEIPSSWK